MNWACSGQPEFSEALRPVSQGGSPGIGEGVCVCVCDCVIFLMSMSFSRWQGGLEIHLHTVEFILFSSTSFDKCITV